MATQTIIQETVPLRSRIWVSAADGATATLQGLAGSAVLTYYFTRWRGLDAGLAAIVWLLFGLWNAVNDPLFGYISDRTKNKLGRRVPYIRYGAPIFGLSFVACWVNWPGTQTDQTAMFVQMLLLLFVFDSLYTAIATSIYIMPYEMAVSNKARSSIYVWKIVFQLLSTAVPLVLIPIIQPGPGEDATSFRWIMTAFGIGMGAVIFLSTFNYTEKHFQQTEEQFSFFKSLKECFRNLSFVVFEVISFITKPAISIAQAVFLNTLVIYGYDQTLAKGLQSNQAQTGILVAWGLIPAILLFVSFLLLQKYPLFGAEWDKIKDRLALLHEEKERVFMENAGFTPPGTAATGHGSPD